MPIDPNANPYIMRMRKKLNTPKLRARERGKNLKDVDQVAAALTRSKKKAALWEDISNHWRTEDELAQELAKKHGKNVKWMRMQLNRSSKYGQQRAVSRYNAFISCQSLVINEDAPPGEKARLKDLHELAKRTSSYKDIPESQMQEMVHCLEEKRLKEKKGMRSRPAAHLQDVKTTAKHLGDELKDLGSRCQTSSMMIVVRTEPTHSNPPLSHHDDISRDFIELLFGMDFDEFAIKFEAYALFRLKGLTKNVNERKTMTKRIVCQMVKRGLHAITGNKNLDMEWKRYESKIVNAYQVGLVGWPEGIVFDPHVLGVRDLEICMSALKGTEPTCYWRKLTVDELTKRQDDVAAKKVSGEIVTKERKKRSDAGKKRKGKKKASGNDSGSDKENNQQRRSKKKRGASIIESDED